MVLIPLKTNYLVAPPCQANLVLRVVQEINSNECTTFRQYGNVMGVMSSQEDKSLSRFCSCSCLQAELRVKTCFK